VFCACISTGNDGCGEAIGLLVLTASNGEIAGGAIDLFRQPNTRTV